MGTVYTAVVETRRTIGAARWSERARIQLDKDYDLFIMETGATRLPWHDATGIWHDYTGGRFPAFTEAPAFYADGSEVRELLTGIADRQGRKALLGVLDGLRAEPEGTRVLVWRG